MKGKGMIKVSFVNSTLNTGGAEKVCSELIRRMDRGVFNVNAYCLYKPGSLGTALISQGVGLKHDFMKSKYDIPGFFKFLSMVKKDIPDILCLEASPLVLFWGFLASRILGISRVITVVHNMKPSYPQRFKTPVINRLILKRLDMVIAVSNARLELLIKECGLDQSKTILVYNGVDTDKFINKKDENMKKQLGIKSGDKVIGMVGRLVHEKAYDVFLKSAKKILYLVPNAMFVIAGDGEKKRCLEELCAELGIQDRVLFLGERQDIPCIISIFDVAVLSSRVESLPLAVLEYMAASKPAVVTDVGGVSEIIVKGETGILVPPENPDMLAMAVAGLINNAELAEKIGSSARKAVVERFSIKSQVAGMEKIFIGLKMNKRTSILMSGPSLDVKGGVSSFGKYYLAGIKGSERFTARYHPTTIDGSKIAKSLFFIKSIVEFLIILLSDRSIRIVHICSSSHGSFYRKAAILLISKIFRKPAVFHIHASSFDLFYYRGHILERWFIKKMLNISDAIVVLSKSWYLSISNMTDNRNIKIIPYPVNVIDTVFSARERNGFGLNVVTSGRLGQRKGTYDILKIVSSIEKEVPGVCFYLAGDGDIEKVSRICREKRIEKNVHLSGWLDRPQLTAMLRNADVFLLPSYNEGLPIAILEAMASGLPVISTRVGGIPEAVEDGVNGFLINPGDIEDMKSKIITLLKDRDLRQRMGRISFEKINSTFRLDRVMEKFYREYENLLTAGGLAS
ncbi:MAG: glycosyltransferase [Candidatus Omnitrophota bacterium]|nr:glycosyltransferase [Candidatus Omnitrophota bacterium]